MRIAINLFLTSPQSVTGAFVYIRNILPAILEADRENTYYIVGDAKTIKYFNLVCRKYRNVKYRVFDIRRDVFINPIRAGKKLIAKIRHDNQAREKIIAKEVNSYLQKNKITLYFSPSSAIFPRDLEDVKFVTTILDLQQEYLPENFSPNYLAQRKKDCAYSVDKSERLITISEYTKKTLIEKYDALPEKITVIYLAPAEIKNGPTTTSLPKEFILYPAAIWPHKNHRVLIEAMKILKNKFPNLHALCPGIVKSKALKQELESLTKSAGLENKVVFPGYIPDEELHAFYSQAKALIFPSAFEGFGIPIVEAFRFGLPVIASDNSSITEIVGKAGILVKTGDAESFANAIELVLTDNQIRNEMIRKGLERAKKFSWKNAAKETLAVFNPLLKNEPPNLLRGNRVV
jgi:glycosyltransferase involved in cell wall biosynthesis